MRGIAVIATDDKRMDVRLYGDTDLVEAMGLLEYAKLQLKTQMVGNIRLAEQDQTEGQQQEAGE